MRLGYKTKQNFILCAKLLVLAVLVITMITPVLFMLSSAFKKGAEINSWPPSLFPKQPILSNFGKLMDAARFDIYFLNSMKMALVSTIGMVVSSTVAGYVFAKYKFRARNLLFGLVLSSSMIPFEIYMIPLDEQMVDLKLNNTFAGLIIPYLVMSFGIFFMRQIVSQQIPDELLEAARIDGCSEMRIFLQIVMPLLRSGIAALSIFAFVEGWNAFIWPLIMVSSDSLFTMELGLALFQTQFQVDMGAVAAGSLLSAAPIMVVFLAFRRQILDSVAFTGTKG